MDLEADERRADSRRRYFSLDPTVHSSQRWIPRTCRFGRAGEWDERRSVSPFVFLSFAQTLPFRSDACFQTLLLRSLLQSSRTNPISPLTGISPSRPPLLSRLLSFVRVTLSLSLSCAPSNLIHFHFDSGQSLREQWRWYQQWRLFESIGSRDRSGSRCSRVLQCVVHFLSALFSQLASPSPSSPSDSSPLFPLIFVVFAVAPSLSDALLGHPFNPSSRPIVRKALRNLSSILTFFSSLVQLHFWITRSVTTGLSAPALGSSQFLSFSTRDSVLTRQL